MTETGRVVVIGDALIDELRDESGVREFVGGAALNVAVGLSRLGLPTTLIAMVGEDEAGDRIRSYLDDYGVDLVATPSPLGSSRAVSTRVDGEPVYEFNAAAQARRIHFGEAERSVVSGAAVTVISCFPFDDEEQTAELVSVIEHAPALVALDPNPRAGMMRDRAAFVRGFERAAASCDLVKVGDDDAELLYGEPLDDLARALLDVGATAVLATRGAQGASVFAPGVEVSMPIAEAPGPVIDTMGAGDAVLSSAVASLQSGMPGSSEEWTTVLATAMQVAAATCRFEGALLRLPSALSGLAAEDAVC
ncbi:PfkB family carbohydrate kinase [Microbacterium sp. SORGH_AS_0888]|uniref:PfkB family carbohydrate kinase n=1 Tax=Microbacterium sp. SORGH_AS_0888 TaxID=3041791 RepID=UPI00277E55D6|nr:PfkB family carbohydrate kinase [Microbacterium sp. SORGH_AS_0888]MDQ1130684.1 fructokinase [Microbacterium sp. SORGH_AS_0888]